MEERYIRCVLGVDRKTGHDKERAAEGENKRRGREEDMGI